MRNFYHRNHKIFLEMTMDNHLVNRKWSCYLEYCDSFGSNNHLVHFWSHLKLFSRKCLTGVQHFLYLLHFFLRRHFHLGAIVMLVNWYWQLHLKWTKTLYRTRPFNESWEVSIEHLRRVWHADRGRLLLRTPRPVPLGLAYLLLVETNLLHELIFPDYALRISLGTFSILLHDAKKISYVLFCDNCIALLVKDQER